MKKTMEFCWGTDINPYIAQIEVMAYMLLPQSEQERERYVAFNSAHLMLKINESDEITIPRQMLQAFLSTERPERYTTTLPSDYHRGNLAGIILRSLLAMKADGISPSVNKAITLARDYFARALDQEDRKISINDPVRIRGAWTAYKCVSHLWAAFYIFHESLGAERMTDFVTEHPLAILAAAEEIRKASGCLPGSIGTELISAPDGMKLPKVNFEITGLSDVQMTVLREHYKRL